MPGYPRKSEYTTPQPSDLIKTVEKRFVMPKITLVQVILIAVIIAYAWSARKMNGMVVGTLAITVALLHMYDHLYLVKRGSEKSIFAPSTEKYTRIQTMLHDSLQRKVEKYSCQSCK